MFVIVFLSLQIGFMVEAGAYWAIASGNESLGASLFVAAGYVFLSSFCPPYSFLRLFPHAPSLSPDGMFVQNSKLRPYTNSASYFVGTLAGFEVFISQLLASVDFPYQLPVGDISHIIKGHSEKANNAKQYPV